MPSIRVLAALALAPTLLAGCGITPAGMAAATAGADVVAVTTTKKTIRDHIVSGVTGEECSAVNYEQTGQYCPERVVVDRSNMYCYRTLADVDCHYTPDPYKNGHQSLASPPPVRKPIPPKKGWFDGWFGPPAQDVVLEQ